MFGPKKGHFLIIFNNFFSEITKLILPIMVAIFASKNSGDIFSIVFPAAILLIGLAPKFFGFKFTTYEITEDMFLIHKGIFNKKKIEIPLETITTVDLTENIIFQIGKVSLITIETTVQTGGNEDSRGVFALKKEEALEFKELLIHNRNLKILGIADSVSNSQIDHNFEKSTLASNATNIETVKIPSNRILLMGLIQSKLQYILLPIAFIASIMGMVSSLIKDYVENINFDKYIDAYDTFLIESFDFNSTMIGKIMWGIAIIVIILFILQYVFATFLSLLMTMVKYYGFAIQKVDNTVYITHGLTNKKKVTLTNDKISGIAIRQSFLMRIFGYYTIEIFAIGYGENTANVALLLPIGNKQEITQLINTILPEISLEEIYSRNKENTLKYYFYNFGTFFLLSMLIGVVVLSLLVKMPVFIYGLIPWIILLIILHIVSCIKKYKEEKISIGKETISHIKGGYGRKIVFLKVPLIETATAQTTTLKRKKEICNIKLKFFGPQARSTTKIKNLRFEDYDRIKGMLKY